jgi:phosphoenolpyruvate carboxykinase (ATP)
VWLINTGWTGGPQGQGSRIDLTHTRSMVRAVLGGELNGVGFTPDPVLGVQVPNSCPGVPAQLLQPRTTWKNSSDYDAAARRLTDLFRANFKAFAAAASEAVRKAGP